ncbi:MAG: hypothetical protein ACF787_02450 [Rhodopirellula sp. JB053]
MQLDEALTVFLDGPYTVASREAINEFCESNPRLPDDVTQQLVSILRLRENGWLPQLFAASLLSRYDELDPRLMEPLLWAAIEVQNPSVNKDFLMPCLNAFSAEAIIDWLVGTLTYADQINRIGISSLVYWLKGRSVDPVEWRQRKKDGLEVDKWLASHAIDATKLKMVIAESARTTDNLVEQYHYRLALPEMPELFLDVPDCASGLTDRITGNSDYEELLYDRLGWQRSRD